jgi:hypothetical protein
MKRKEKSGNFRGMEPSSSHPEAEAGVEIFSPATRSALRRNRNSPERELRKPIVSIHGRDVEEVPDTKGRVA